MQQYLWTSSLINFNRYPKKFYFFLIPPDFKQRNIQSNASHIWCPKIRATLMYWHPISLYSINSFSWIINLISVVIITLNFPSRQGANYNLHSEKTSCNCVLIQCIGSDLPQNICARWFFISMQFLKWFLFINVHLSLSFTDCFFHMLYILSSFASPTLWITLNRGWKNNINN